MTIKPLYIDVHILHTVPPANLNRDDQGSPKEAYFGGVRRSRVSSQAWKRATRLAFTADMPKADLGTRTRKIAGELADRIQDRTHIGTDHAARLASAVLAPLGISAGKKAEQTAYLLFYGRRQLERIVDLIASDVPALAEMDDEALAKTVEQYSVREQLSSGHPIDVALFGRMVADIPFLNVDAATQVAHALSTHAVELEFDYFTAVDDENTAEETGAGMIGHIGFNSATLYRYATVGLHQLYENLGEIGSSIDAVARFVKAFALSMPSGYANSFAPNTRPSVVAVVVRDDQPVNLVTAFEKPVASRDGITEESARRLAEEYARATKAWGDKPAHVAAHHALGEDSNVGTVIAEAFGSVAPTFTELVDGLREHLEAVTSGTGA